MFLKGYFGLILFGTVIVHLSSSESVLNCLSSSVRYQDQTNRNWVGLTCPAGKHIQVTDYRFVFEPNWREVCPGNVPTPNNECSKSSISLLRATINNCNGKDSCDIPYDFTSAVENEVTPETTGSCSIDGGLSNQPGLAWSGVVVFYDCIAGESVLNCFTSAVRYQDQTNRNWVGLTCPAGKHIQVTDYRFVYEPNWREVCTGNVPTPNNECSKSSISLLRATINNCNGQDSCDIPYNFTSAVRNEVTPETTGSCSIDGGLSSQPGRAWSGVVVFYNCIELEFSSAQLRLGTLVSGSFINPVLETPGYPSWTELRPDYECSLVVAENYFMEASVNCQPEITFKLIKEKGLEDFTCGSNQSERNYVSFISSFRNMTLKLNERTAHKGAFSMAVTTYNEDTRIASSEPVHVTCKYQASSSSNSNAPLFCFISAISVWAMIFNEFLAHPFSF